MIPADTVIDQVRACWRAPERHTIAEWAERYRVLSAEASRAQSKFRCDQTPYMVGVMEAMSDPNVREVWGMMGAQLGKTETLNNAVGQRVDEDPGPMLIVQPSLEMARTWSQDRLRPMVRDTPRLHGKIKGPSKDGSSTMLHKQFPGGHLTIVGANSAAGLASRPIRDVYFDEVDRYPTSAGDEGDPVELGRARTVTFKRKARISGFSTPDIKGVSRIEKAFESGDRRYYQVPCQFCGHMQKLEWENLRFQGDGVSIEQPGYVCAECGEVHYEQHKMEMLRGGKWVATANFHGIASFQLSALYSPWKTWHACVSDYLRARKGGPEMMKTFHNLVLGETWEETGEVIDADMIAGRSHVQILTGDKILVPEGALVGTWGADVQGDRLEVELVGWGEEDISWSICYEIINGSPENPLTWQKFDDWLNRSWYTACGRKLDVPIGGIDTGDGNTTKIVYEWVKPRMGHRRGALPFKGSNVFNAPIWTSPTKPKKGERDVIKPYMIGVSQAKLAIYRRLSMSEVGPGYMHFPTHYDEKYFKGLTAEKLVTKYDKGFPRKEWHLPDGRRNEPLDCRVYAYAAKEILNPDYKALAARFRVQDRHAEPSSTESTQARARPRRQIRKPRMRVRM